MRKNLPLFRILDKLCAGGVEYNKGKKQEKGGGAMRRREGRGRVLPAALLSAAVAAAALLGGCAAHEDASLPPDCPRSMTSLAYDEGRADEPTEPVTVTYAYVLDAAGRVTERRYTLSGVAYRETTDYDADGRVVRTVSDRLAGDAPAAGSTAHVYTYDPAGRRLTDETYAREGGEETLTVRTVYTYGEGARAQSAAVFHADGTQAAAVTFTYSSPAADDGAALEEETRVCGADGAEISLTRCVYDAADRPLTRFVTSGDSVTRETYAYDAAGRLLTHTAHIDGVVYEEQYEYSS